MYRRVEVLVDGQWRGPMKATGRFGRFDGKQETLCTLWRKAGLKSPVLDGGMARSLWRVSRFAWTELGWEKAGQATLERVTDWFGVNRIRAVILEGKVLYQDELQVAVRVE